MIQVQVSSTATKYTKVVKVFGMTVYRFTETTDPEKQTGKIGFSAFPDQRQYVDEEDD